MVLESTFSLTEWCHNWEADFTRKFVFFITFCLNLLKLNGHKDTDIEALPVPVNFRCLVLTRLKLQFMSQTYFPVFQIISGNFSGNICLEKLHHYKYYNRVSIDDKHGQ